MNKVKSFKVLWKYIKDDKFKLFIYVLLVILTYAPTILSAVFWGKALEELLTKNIYNFVIYLGLWEGLYIIFYSILQLPRDYLYNYLEIKFIKNASKDLYKKINNLPAIAFEKIGVGEFINRLYSDTDRVMELLAKLIKLVCKALVVVFVLIISFKVSIILGIEIIIFGLIMGFISYKFFPKIKKVQEEIKKESDDYVKTATENITGIREIKSLGIKKIIEKDIFKKIDSLYHNTNKIKKSEYLYYCLNNLAYFILQFIILFTCGYLFIEGKIEYSVFVMIEMYICKIDEVVESISDFGVSYNKVTVSLKRIGEILENVLYEDEKFGNTSIDKVKGVIEFKNVGFKYANDEEETLKGRNIN